jgi:hypothetical protein
MTKQEHEVSKALGKVEKVLEEIVLKGLDDSLCKYWGKELQHATTGLRQALNIEP